MDALSERTDREGAAERGGLDQLAAFREALGRIGFSVPAQDALNRNGFNGSFRYIHYRYDRYLCLI